MSYVFEEALEAAATVKKVAGDPVVGVILGSGLGQFSKKLPNPEAVPYTRIPNFPPARVEGHAGQLMFSTVDGVRIGVLSGRVHYYEGHSFDTVSLGARTLALLGVKALIVTNAAGGIRDDLAPGQLMLVRDHINLMGANPLVGQWDPRLGPRYPDMTHAYDAKLRAAVTEAAKKARVKLTEGVYAAVSGPSYETPAEIRMLETLGADAVGMSTVPEVIAANQMGVGVVGISCIANLAAGRTGNRLSHQEVMEETNKASKRFCRLLNQAIPLVARAAAKKARAKASKRSATIEEQRSVGRSFKSEKKKTGKGRK